MLDARICIRSVGETHRRFRGRIGYAKGNHYVMSDQPPIFKKRSVPYARKRRLEEELDRLMQTKVIEPVRYSDWTTPIVPS